MSGVVTFFAVLSEGVAGELVFAPIPHNTARYGAVEQFKDESQYSLAQRFDRCPNQGLDANYDLRRLQRET